MTKMTQFQQGYQAALADISAALESTESMPGDDRGDFEFRQVQAVENWIKNNTPASTVYRGYTLTKNGNWVDIYKDDEWLGSSNSITLAKREVDGFQNGK